jgi:hypothetical protein
MLIYIEPDAKAVIENKTKHLIVLSLNTLDSKENIMVCKFDTITISEEEACKNVGNR